MGYLISRMKSLMGPTWYNPSDTYVSSSSRKEWTRLQPQEVEVQEDLMVVPVSEIGPLQLAGKERGVQLQHCQETKQVIWLDTTRSCLIFAETFSRWRMRMISFVLQ